MIGRLLGHYTILDRLGEGGMGVVYKALDTRLNRHVAIKVLPPELLASEERRLRFQREAQAAAALNHPNICTIHGVDTHEGVDYLVMELLEGQTLRERIGHRPMPLKTLLPIAIQVGDALTAAHEGKVLHRDLKPDNIFITTQGIAKVVDFGLAKVLEPVQERPAGGAAVLRSRLETVSRELTRQGKVFGTVTYMSPEQAKGERVDHRSDLFSFGIVLYEMATGRQPFKGKTDAETLASIIKEEPAPVSAVTGEAQPELDRIIGKCLEKDPQDRYHHADDMVTDLRRLKRVTDSGVQAVRTPGAPQAVAQAAARRRGLIARAARRPGVAGVLALAIVAAGFGTWWLSRTPERFQQGDRIVVADFENATGRPELDLGIRDALEDRLALSDYVNVIRGNRLQDLLKQQGAGPVSRIDLKLASEICGAGRCAGYVAGRISTVGTGYRLEADLHRTGRSRPAIVRSVTAEGEQEILKAVHDLALDLRRALGEAPQSVSSTSPPTTRSLAAYRAFAIAQSQDLADEAVTLFRQALDLDPDFVDAYSGLGLAHWHRGSVREYRRFVGEAYRRSSALPERQRLGLEIDVLDASYDYDTEEDRLKAYLRRYPADRGALNYLGFNYLVVYQDPVLAEAPLRGAYELRRGFVDLSLLADSLALQGRNQEIGPLVADFLGRGGSESEADLVMLLVDDDWEKQRAVVERLKRLPEILSLRATGTVMMNLLAKGRLSEARRQASSLGRSAEQARLVLPDADVALAASWLEMRLTGKPPTLSPGLIRRTRESLPGLPHLVTFSVDARLAHPVSEVVQEHEEVEKESRSRYVREELQFARAGLLLIRGEAAEAWNVLEPLAHNSKLIRRHQMLGRAGEALGKWSEAAAAYEEALRNPHLKWYVNPAVFVLDQFRLAQIYERLGDPARARQWYGRFLTDWKDADPDIPEVIEARKRLEALEGAPGDAGGGAQGQTGQP